VSKSGTLNILSTFPYADFIITKSIIQELQIIFL